MANTIIGPIGNKVGASNSGVTNTLTVDNASNTASSQANVLITVGGGTAGDAWNEYVINGVTTWSTGIDNSDSDKFKITTGADPSSGTTAISITTAGLVTISSLASGLTGILVGNGASAITATTVTQFDVLVGGASNTISSIGPGSAGQVLQSGGAGANPAYSTATYPSTATGTGTILRADGTNWVATTATYPNTVTVSNILYGSATNVVSGLATANNGMLVTSNTGVPSILAGPGTTGNVLQSNAAAAPSFSTATYPSTATGTGTILRADGTNWVATTATYPATTTINQLLYSSAANVVSGLTTANNGVVTTGTTGTPVVTALATDGQVIIGSTTGAPAAATLSAGTGISITNGHNSISIAATGSAGIGNITVQRFTSTGAFTYTPTAGTKFAIVELVGGGGGGGSATNGINFSGGGGGGSGAYAKFILTSVQIGASLTGSVGTGGGVATAGGDTTLATTSAWTAGKGSGGTTATSTAVFAGGAGGTVTTGTGSIIATMSGQAGSAGAGNTATPAAGGGSNPLGFGGPANASVGTTTNGGTPTGFGSGGGGAFSNNGTGTGASGNSGIAIFTEYQ